MGIGVQHASIAEGVQAEGVHPSSNSSSIHLRLIFSSISNTLVDCSSSSASCCPRTASTMKERPARVLLMPREYGLLL